MGNHPHSVGNARSRSLAPVTAAWPWPPTWRDKDIAFPCGIARRSASPPWRERGGIRLSNPTSPDAHAPIAVATSKMAAALAGTRLVLVAVPASGHAEVARACAPHLRDGQAVLLLARPHGRVAGVPPRAAMRPAAALAFCSERPIRSPWPRTRRTGRGGRLWHQERDCGGGAAGRRHVGAARRLPAAVAHASPRPLRAAHRLCQPRRHPASRSSPCLTPNASREASSFDFYAEGVTPAVADVLAAADTERLRIARAYGVAVASLSAWIGQTYGHHADTVHAAVGGNPAYRRHQGTEHDRASLSAGRRANGTDSAGGAWAAPPAWNRRHSMH